MLDPVTVSSFLKNLSPAQSHAHSPALCCSCFPGGLLVPRLARRAQRASGSLSFSFFFFSDLCAFGPWDAAGGKKSFREAAAVIVASLLAAFAPGSRAEAGECGLVTSSDIGTFSPGSRSRREEKVK